MIPEESSLSATSGWANWMLELNVRFCLSGSRTRAKHRVPLDDATGHLQIAPRNRATSAKPPPWRHSASLTSRASGPPRFTKKRNNQESLRQSSPAGCGGMDTRSTFGTCFRCT